MRIQDKQIFMNRIALFFVAGLVLLSSCKKKEPSTATAPPPPVTPAAPAVTETPKEKPVYVYAGDKFRDPFTAAGQISGYQTNVVFDPQRASVKGIIYGPSFRSAVLLIGGSGTYYVVGKRIFDIMGKVVDGYSAQVQSKKVIIEGTDDKVFELKLRDSDQEGKT